MSFASAVMDADHRRQGAQLVTAVALAWLIAWAAHLPEPGWAMISTLIVMRSSSGATLRAGRDRMFGTMAGALCGLAAVYLRTHWMHGDTTTLLMTAALAYLSASLPSWRSAPITALIVIGASLHATDAAVHVAILRVIQIFIGIAAALLVALLLLRVRGGDRLRRGCGTILRGQAASLMRLLDSGPPSVDAPRAAERLREGLDRLGMLAAAQDWASAHRLRGQAMPGELPHVTRIDRLRRVVQDVGALRRVLQLPAVREHDRLVAGAARAAAGALAGTADALTGKGMPSLDALRTLAGQCADGGSVSCLLAGPLRLLLEDLTRLSPAPAAPSD